eukprot:1114168-Amorphochlora_amoeboformis.AAC.1
MGATLVSTPAEVAERSDVVFLIVGYLLYYSFQHIANLSTTQLIRSIPPTATPKTSAAACLVRTVYFQVISIKSIRYLMSLYRLSPRSRRVVAVKGMKSGGVVVDMTTSDPELAIEIYKKSKEIE